MIIGAPSGFFELVVESRRERRVDAGEWRSGPAAMTRLSASNWPSAAGHHADDPPPTVTG